MSGFSLVTLGSSLPDQVALARMVVAVTDGMLDVWALAGTPDEVREQYDRRWAGTYDETILYPPNFAGGAHPEAILQTFGDQRPA